MATYEKLYTVSFNIVFAWLTISRYCGSSFEAKRKIDIKLILEAPTGKLV